MKVDMEHALQIGNNMHKAKYELLNSAFENRKPTRYTNIFILVDSISRSVLALSNETSEMLVPERFLSELLGTAGHYKRFFSKLWPQTTVFIFLYFDDIREGDAGNIRHHYAMKLVNDLAKTVASYIPNLYWVPCSYPVCAFPYSIISDMEKDALLRQYNGNHTAVAVSDNPPDYYMLSMSTGQNTMAVFRRKRSAIFTISNILTDYFLQHRKYDKQLLAGRLDFILPRAIVAWPDRFLPHHGIDRHISEYYQGALKRIVSTNADESEKTIIDVISEEGRSYDLFSAVQSVDASAMAMKHAKRIMSEKLVWKHDRIDYDIESLNSTVFKNFPVDFSLLV